MLNINNALSEQGNPADAPAVVAFVGGYAQTLFDLGLDAVPAVPLSPEKLTAVSRSLDVEAMEALAFGAAVSPVTAASLLRDRALFLVAGCGGDRGSEAGKLRRECFRGLRHSSGGPDLVIDYESTRRGQDLSAHGRGKKQSRRKRTSAYRLHRLSSGLGPFDAVVKYLHFMDTYGLWAPRGPEEPFYVFPVVARGGGSFTNTPLAANAISSRLKAHLTVAGCFAGETSHSLRRGHFVSSPLTSDELSKVVSVTRQTIELYRDPRR